MDNELDKLKARIKELEKQSKISNNYIFFILDEFKKIVSEKQFREIRDKW